MRHLHALPTFALALVILAAGCDAEPLGSTDAPAPDPSDAAPIAADAPPAAGLGCQLMVGGASPGKGAVPLPWVALWHNGQCSTTDLATLVVTVNGAPMPVTLAQTWHEMDGHCAIWWLSESADTDAEWSLEWHTLGPPLLAGAIHAGDAPDYQPGWAVWYLGPGEGVPEWGATPGDYGPRCSIPLDWYTGDWWPQ